MKKLILINVILFALVACETSVEVSTSGDTEMKAETAATVDDQLLSAPVQPEILAPGFLSTGLYERDFAISPDGSEIFYSVMMPDRTLHMMHTTISAQGWSEPTTAAFNTEYNDLEPFFADNETLYFVSTRPKDGDDGKLDSDIYRVVKVDGVWGEPENIGAPVNTEGHEFYPSLTKAGTIYYCARYDENEDIYRAKSAENGFQEPERLTAPLNTEYMEYNAFIDPEERFIVFGSFGREDGLGGGDLYICYRNADDSWTEARNLGEPFNSERLDFCPFVSRDGEYFVFTSSRMKQIPFKTLSELEAWQYGPGNGNGDLYVVDAEALNLKQ